MKVCDLKYLTKVYDLKNLLKLCDLKKVLSRCAILTLKLIPIWWAFKETDVGKYRNHKDNTLLCILSLVVLI